MVLRIAFRLGNCLLAQLADLLAQLADLLAQLADLLAQLAERSRSQLRLY